jgi:multicomponent Na+:H+ antiporter subunit A
VSSNLVLRVGVRATFHTILLFAVYLLLAGHNAPGGGFVAGLVAGAAFVLRDVASDFPSRRRRLEAESMLAAGLGLALVTGVAALLAGGSFFEADKFVTDLPVFGHVAVTSALAFDLGVFLVVLGVVLSVVHHLGEEEEAA